MIDKRNVSTSVSLVSLAVTFALCVMQPTLAQSDEASMIKAAKSAPLKQRIAKFDEVLRAYPKSVDALLLRSGAKINAKDLDGAVQDAAQAVNISPNNPKAYADRGFAKYIRRKGTDLKEALDDLNKAIKLNPQEFAFYGTRGQIEAVLGDKNAALRDLDKGISMRPTEPASYIERSQVREKFGDIRGAVDDLKQSKKLDPDFFMAQDDLDRLEKKLK